MNLASAAFDVVGQRADWDDKGGRLVWEDIAGTPMPRTGRSFAGGLRQSEIVALDHRKDDTPDSGGWVEIHEGGALVVECIGLR